MKTEDNPISGYDYMQQTIVVEEEKPLDFFGLHIEKDWLIGIAIGMVLMAILVLKIKK